MSSLVVEYFIKSLSKYKLTLVKYKCLPPARLRLDSSVHAPNVEYH